MMWVTPREKTPLSEGCLADRSCGDSGFVQRVGGDSARIPRSGTLSGTLAVTLCVTLARLASRVGPVGMAWMV